MGQTHAGSILRCKDAELVGIVNRSSPLVRLATVGGNRPTEPLDPAVIASIPHFTDLDHAIAESGADACFVALPTKHHCDATIKALESGMHVFVEKPFGIRHEECAGMIAAAETSGKVLAVGYLTRFAPENKIVRQAFRSASCGKPLFALFQRWTGMPDWGSWKDPEFVKECGGGIIDLMSHDIDFVRFCFGEPESVTIDPDVSKAFPNNAVCAGLHYAGFDVKVQGGFVSPSSFPFRKSMDVWFENASFSGTGGNLTRCNADGVHQVDIPKTNNYVAELNGFLKAVRTGDRADICSGADAAKTIDLCLKIRELAN